MPAVIILGVAAYTGVTAIVGGAIGAAITGAAVSATAATAIGTAVISGGITAIQGGSASDVLKSAVIGGITAGVGSSISASIASDVAFNAIASGTSGQIAVVMGNAIGGAAAGALSSGVSALLSDKDPVEALIRGGLTAGLSAGVNSAVYEITKDIPLLSNPSNKIESAFQRATKSAIATGILGGSASDAFTQSVITSFGAMGFDYIKNAIKDYSGQLKNAATDVETAGNAVSTNAQEQNEVVTSYENLASEFNSLYDQIAPAQAEYDAALETTRLWSQQNGLVPSPTFYYYLNQYKAVSDAKLATLNQKIETYNNFYTNNIDTLNGYVSTLDTLKAEYPELLNTYTEEETEFKKALEEFQVQETKNATLALKGLEDTAIAKRIFIEQEGREPTDAELAQYATDGDLVGNVDRAKTTRPEAIEFWKQTFGTEPTDEELQMVMRGSETAAEIYTQNLSEIQSVTPLDDPFANQAAIELAAKEAGFSSYTYNGETYSVNDNNIAATIDGTAQKEATRLISGALAAQGMRLSDAAPEEIEQLVKSVHSMYGNDVSRLKAASIQDFINGNAKYLDQIQTSYTTEGGWRVQITGSAIGDWFSPGAIKDEAIKLLPAGLRLATDEEVFDTVNRASLITLSNGETAWVVNKTADELPDELDIIAPNLGTLAPDDPSSADPAAYIYTLARFDPGKAAAGETLVNAAKTVVDLINNSGASPAVRENILDAVAVTLQGTAELTKLFSDAVWSTGLVNRDNAAARIADAVGKYGASLQSASTQQQEANILKAVGDAQGAWGTIGATIKAIYQNPAGALTLIGKEAVQEIPVLAASGGVGRLVLGVAGKGLAYSAAMGTNAALDAAESYGAGFGETYDNVRKAGGSDEYAKSQAYKSGFQAALVSTGSSLLGDSALVKKFMGDMTNLTLPAFGKEVSKQYVTEWGEEFVQNASVQYNSYGTVNWDQARTAGAIGGLVGAGVAGGILAPSAVNYQLQVARDLQGNAVTLQQVVDGTVQIDPSSINTAAPVFNINGVGVSIDGFTKVADTAISQPDFSFTSYSNSLKSLYDTGFTDSDVSDIALQVSLAPDANTLNTQLQSMGLTPAEALTATDIKFDDQVTTQKEVENAFDRYSYFDPDAQTIESFTGLKGDADLNKAVEDYIAPRYTTPDEARAFFESVGYKPNEQEVAQFAGQVSDATQSTAISTYAAQNTFDIAEVKAAAAQEGITLTDEQAKQYVRQAPENQAATELRAQLDPTITTTEEAVQFLRDSGFTEEQATAAAAQFVGSAEATAQQRVAAYTDPRQVTFAEAKKFLTDLGYTPTDEEVNQFVKQSTDPITEAIRQQVGAYVDPRQLTVQEVKDAAAAAGIPLTDEEATVYAGQKSQETALGTLVQDITRDLKLATTQDIKEAIAGIDFPEGITSEDVTNAIANYMQANPGLSAADVSKQVAAELEKLPDYATPADVSAAISNALFNYATKEDVLGVEDRLTQEFDEQITAGLESIKTDLANAEARINERAAEYEAAGLSRDEALSTAISDVAAQLGTTATNLTSQIDAAKTALGTQITEVKTDLQQQIDQAAQLLGKPAQAVTQQDIDFVNSVIQQTPTTYTAEQLTYDVNRDQKIDQQDVDILTRLMTPTTGEPPEIPAGTRWAPTGLFGEIAGLRTDLVGQLQEAERQRAAEAERANQEAEERAKQAEANARARAQQQRQYSNVQQLQSMLMQPGALTQKVDVKTPEVLKLNQLYDWSSIFATPQQQQLFASPYGTYADGGEVTEEELLQIVRG